MAQLSGFLGLVVLLLKTLLEFFRHRSASNRESREVQRMKDHGTGMQHKLLLKALRARRLAREKANQEGDGDA